MILLDKTLKLVNSTINRVRYIPDSKCDEWKIPSKFFKSGGDCEDYAIAKYFELRKRGVDSSDLKIAYCKVNNQAHMVLIYKDLVLDNLTNQIIKLEDKAIKIVYSFNEESVFINGTTEKNNLTKWHNLIAELKQLNELPALMC